MKPEENINPEIQPEELEQTPSAEETENEEQQTEDTAAEEVSVEQQLAELRERCDDLADKNLRMIAEFDNYRRRTAKEKLELQKTAGEAIFKDMLPLVDDFERAVKATEQTDDVEALREGLNLIYQKFLTFLERNDVKPIDTENADFDTAYHEAITTFPAPTEEQKGKVIDCTQRGYTLGDKVIRFAKVVVGE